MFSSVPQPVRTVVERKSMKIGVKDCGIKIAKDENPLH
jgi:hypothetical protein